MTDTNYAVAPGEYLQEWMAEHSMPPQRVAELLGCSHQEINEILRGLAPVTNETATRLEYVTDIPAGSWLRYEAAYRTDLARIADQA